MIVKITESSKILVSLDSVVILLIHRVRMMVVCYVRVDNLIFLFILILRLGLKLLLLLGR